jgi:uncharacterized repeat protein (TIGR01451 family)
MFLPRFANLLPRLSHLMPLACLLLALPAQAEGSKDLISSSGNRPFIDYRTDLVSGIPRKTTIKVFAKSGETINLASSATGIGTSNILYKRPNNTTGSCVAGVGLIADYPAEISQSYTPCTVTVGPSESGVWEIEFTSPSPTTYTNPPPTLATAAWTQSAAVSWVAAWDVTVKSAGGVPIPGRAFANYLALNMGGNSLKLSSKVYIQTNDGYGYTVDMNDLDPFGFIFFANNKGFRDSTGNPVYRSLQFTGGNPGSIPPGYSVQDPSIADNANDFTHKIFFNTTGPDTTMPATANAPGGTTWLYPAVVPPPAPTNLSFEGLEGTPGQAGTNPLGGFFKFTSPAIAPYEVTLKLSKNPLYVDRTLVGTSINGVNFVAWDGKDGNGVSVAADLNKYDFTVELKAGEIHFPFLDAENNPSGLTIERKRDANNGSTASPFEVMYDDRFNFTTGAAYDYSLCAKTVDVPGTSGASCYGTASAIRRELGGVNSNPGAHIWSTFFGDIRGMDTWANYPSASIKLTDAFQVREADLSISKTDNLTTINQGATITYTIIASNATGPSDAIGATVTDTMPAALTNVTWTCTATTGSSCPASGTGNINAVVNLPKGGSVTFTVTAQVGNNATGVITNTAKVLRPKDVNDPTDPVPNGGGNNTAIDTTTIIGSPLMVTKAVALVIDSDGSGNGAPLSIQTATPGDVLEYTIVVKNVSAATATGISLVDSLPANLIYLPNSLKISPTYTTGAAPAGVAMSDAAGDDKGEFTSPNIVARLGNGATGTAAGTLAAGESTVLTFRAKIADPTVASQVSNQATVDSTGNPPRSSDDPSTPPFNDPTVTKVGPRLRLVKRITGIKKFGTLVVIPIGGYNDLATDVADNAAAWPGGPANYLFGVINSGQVPAIPGLPDPKDEIEYTIYFLADGPSAAQGVKLCDFVPTNQTFVAGSITQKLGTVITPIVDVPAIVGDSGFYANGTQPAACPAANNNSNGAVFISPGSVTSIHTTPATASGYFRFRATVK